MIRRFGLAGQLLVLACATVGVCLCARVSADEPGSFGSGALSGPSGGLSLANPEAIRSGSPGFFQGCRPWRHSVI